MSIITFILCAVGIYLVVSYVVGAMSYKANGCGLDALAFIFSPLLLPLIIRDWFRQLKYKLLG